MSKPEAWQAEMPWLAPDAMQFGLRREDGSKIIFTDAEWEAIKVIANAQLQERYENAKAYATEAQAMIAELRAEMQAERSEAFYNSDSWLDSKWGA